MVKEMHFYLKGDYITLGQLLKALDIVPTGGQAKMVILDGEVKVNGAVEMRRGRKLRHGDVVEIWNYRIEIVNGREL